MFTQECFIRKNTKKLRDELEKLGYKNKLFSVCPDSYCIVCHRDGNFYTSDSEDYNGNYDESLKGLIDCGENEKLFLAIAALRDDSDYMQWFVSKGWKDGFGNVEDIWVLCDQDALERFGEINNSPNTYNRKKFPQFGWHKATVEELIEHFNGKLARKPTSL